MTNNNTEYSYEFYDYSTDDIVVAVKNTLDKIIVYTSIDDEHNFCHLLENENDECTYDNMIGEWITDYFNNDELQTVYNYLVENCDTI